MNQVSSTPLLAVDSATGLLVAQLLSSQLSGTFQVNSLTSLGSQSWQTSGATKAVITIDSEQVLATVSVSAGVATCTIAASGRGHNGTTVVTHDPNAPVAVASTAAIILNLQAQIDAIVAAHNADDMAIFGGLIPQAAVTTIASATSHTIAGDQTAVFTVGRGYHFQVGGTWYRSEVEASSFSSPNTTVTLVGNSLPASGTVTSCGFEFDPANNLPMSVQLIADMAADPAVNPPSGANWIYLKAGILYTKNSAGVVTSFALPMTVPQANALIGGILSYANTLHTHDWKPVASDNVRMSSAGAKSTSTNNSAVLLKAFVFRPFGLGTIRVKGTFTQAQYGGDLYAYVGGVNVANIASASGSFSADVTMPGLPYNGGDVSIEIYGSGDSNGHSSSVSSVTVCFEKAAITAEAAYGKVTLD